MTRPIRVHFNVSRLKGHNCWWEFTEAPPEGVEYVYPRPGEVGYIPDGDVAKVLNAAKPSAFKKRVYEPFVRAALGGVGLRAWKDRLTGNRQEYDLYHSMGSVHPFPEPWLVGCESSVDFFTFGESWREEMDRPSSRAFVRRKLLSRHCKKLLPWSEPARQSILGLWDDAATKRALDEKIEILPLAIRAGPEPPPMKRAGPVRLLFTGSRQYPQDFLPKGGHLVLATFAELKKRGHDVELVVRAKVPDKYLKMYGDTPGLTILDKDLTFDELEALLDSCHVFIFPGSSTPGMAIREAMRAAKPVVTIDAWMNKDLVLDGVTGFVAEPPMPVDYVNKYGALNWDREGRFIETFENNVDRSVASLVEKTEKLVTDAALRERMGKAGRQEIVSGRFSIGVRNKALRRIYEEALKA